MNNIIDTIDLASNLAVDVAASAAIDVLCGRLTADLACDQGCFPGLVWNAAMFSWLRGEKTTPDKGNLQLLQLEDALFSSLSTDPLCERIRAEAWRQVARYQSSYHCWDDPSRHTYGEVPNFIPVCQEVATRILTERALWHVSWDPDLMTVSARPGAGRGGLPRNFEEAHARVV